MTDARPQIALLVRSLTGGGAERVMLNLALGLARRGLRVDIVATAAGQVLPEDAPETLQLITLEHWQIGRWALNWQRPVFRTLVRWGALVQYLQRVQPPVLLSAMHYLNETAILAVKAAGGKTRCVVAEHTHLTLESRWVEQWQARWSPLFVRCLYPLADQVVAVSKGVAADLAPLVRLDRRDIPVLYNPVLSKALYEQSEAVIEHEWLQPDSAPVIMGMGRFVRQKNFGLLLQAFALLSIERPEIRLMLVGGGRDRLALGQMAQELGIGDRLALLDFVDKPAAYLKRARVLALSSSWEGLPTVVIEALALGCAVVATDCPSGPGELLAEQRGHLVPPGNPKAMARALALALDQPVRPVSRAWLEQFEVEQAVERYVTALQIPGSEELGREREWAIANGYRECGQGS